MGSPPEISFVELMSLEKDKSGNRSETYISLVPSTGPGSGTAYGGHVFAQAVWAASQTVNKGMVVHNAHGYFTLQGLVDRPYIYTISHISEGRSFCTRSVTVRQPSAPCPLSPSGRFDLQRMGKEIGKTCFSNICSFKQEEPSPTNHQTPLTLDALYGGLITGIDPSTHQIHPRLDAPWYHRHREKHGQTDSFPGLEMRKVDMSSFNQAKPPSDHRQVTYYRPFGSIPNEDYNMHACAHLYASDRNGLYLVSAANGFGDRVNVMASLSHSVVFHVRHSELVLKDHEWWVQEYWTPRSGGGRGMVESRIWDRRGVHVASSWQDGLVRLARAEGDQKQRITWYEGMERLGKIPKGEREKLGDHKL